MSSETIHALLRGAFWHDRIADVPLSVAYISDDRTLVIFAVRSQTPSVQSDGG